MVGVDDRVPAPGDAGASRALRDVLHFGRDAEGTACRQGVAPVVPAVAAVVPAEDAAATVASIPAGASQSPDHATAIGETEQKTQAFTVEAFGRYAVQAGSPQGTALQLVDRMAGPGPEDGAAGERNGRLDVFLGPGQHRAVLTSLTKAKATPTLVVKPFAEQNPAPFPQLAETAMVSAQLDDVQQRSYWLHLTAARTVFVEAAGRHLADLRLWKDGTWLVDAPPLEALSAPSPGRPLAVRRLAVKLPPGLYQVIAYGGPGPTWTQSDKDNPLVLRWGIPRLPATGLRDAVAGPFGFDRWLVPKGANAFHLEVPTPGNAGLEVVPFGDGTFTTGKSASIDKKSRTRSADLMTWPEAGGDQVVTVTRPAGLPYRLQTLVSSREYPFGGAGDYLVGSLRSAHDEDDPDVTTVLTRSPRAGAGAAKGSQARDPGQAEQVIAARTIELGRTTAWHRRFNLLDPVSLFIGVTEAGHYSIDATGVDADLTLAPFGAPSDPVWKGKSAAAGRWDLDGGLYILSITPRPGGRGVVSLALTGAAAGDTADGAGAIVGASFLPVHLDPTYSYRLYANRMSNGAPGALVRKLPLDGEDDVALTIEPCATITLPMSFPAAGTVSAATGDGTALPVSLDDGTMASRAAVSAAGVKTLRISNPGTAAAQIGVHFTPAAPASGPVAAAAPDGTPAPDFPTLEAEKPRFLDLDRQSQATFVVKVDQPALYRLESTGLLETAGVIRTRVLPQLDRAQANGVGRNFLLQQYLREGLYQLTVATEGKTAGHLGVALTPAPVRAGGPLTLGVAAHAQLAAGEGVAYDLDIASRGSYHLQALTLSGPTGLRVEDEQGWPLTTPAETGDLTRDLAPGRYRLVVLPAVLSARVQVLVDEIRSDPAVPGHGPHPLSLDSTVGHRWEEPADGQSRIPDSWTFTLPAAADLTVRLSDLMQADLRREEEPQPLAKMTFRKPWQGRLEAGNYRLEVSTLRPNNHFDYQLTTSLRQLVAGQRRIVTPPAVVPVSLAGGRLVEIASAGGAEVRGILLDKTGAVVARATERPDDWNFTIAASPPAGDYLLKVEAVDHGIRPPSQDGDRVETVQDGSAPEQSGGQAVPTEVRLRQDDDVEEPAVSFPADRELSDGRMHTFPLAPKPADGALLVAAAISRDTVGLSLERRRPDGGWDGIGRAAGRSAHLAVVADPSAQTAFRLRVWSMDHTRAAISLHLAGVTPAPARERSLADGIALAEIPGTEPRLGVAAVALDKPGLVKLDGPASSLTWAAAEGQALGRGPEVVMAGGTALWFIDVAKAGPVRAHRVLPDATTPLALTLPAGQVAALPMPVAGAAGAVLWLAETRLGQPGMAVGGLDAPIDGRIMAVGDGVAAAVLAEAKSAAEPVVRLWRADGGADELPLTLRQLAFPKPAPVDLPWGIHDGTLAGHGATAFVLPAGAKRLQLALPPETAAALLKEGVVDRTLWSGSGPTAQVVETTADGLLLLNSAPAAGQFSAQLSPAAGDQAPMARGSMVRRWYPSGASRRFEIALAPDDRSKGLVLRLAGAVDDATLVSRDGQVRRGTVLPVKDDGVLLLGHRAGLVLAWLDNGDSRSWPAADGAAEMPAVPGPVALSGNDLLWRFDSDGPRLLHVTSATPLMLGLRRPSGVPDLTVWGQGANLHAFLPAGRSLLGVRSLQDGALGGAALLEQSLPVTIGEGLGPTLRLAPGDARLFRFDVTAVGPIGIGVKGKADSARVRLLTAAGEVLAEGVAAMPSLDPGRYYLLVENRPDGAATELQPVLVGATRPDTGPPEDVKRRYWDLVATGEGN